METVIGFVAGYLIGTREGRAGLERFRTSVNAIGTSSEVRRMAGEAISVATTIAAQVARQASNRGFGEIGGTVAQTLTQRGGNGWYEARRAA